MHPRVRGYQPRAFTTWLQTIVTSSFPEESNPDYGLTTGACYPLTLRKRVSCVRLPGIGPGRPRWQRGRLPLHHSRAWSRQDLNPPHPRCKRGALPDELLPRGTSSRWPESNRQSSGYEPAMLPGYTTPQSCIAGHRGLEPRIFRFGGGCASRLRQRPVLRQARRRARQPRNVPQKDGPLSTGRRIRRSHGPSGQPRLCSPRLLDVSQVLF